jgi:hypothetical protein
MTTHTDTERLDLLTRMLTHDGWIEIGTKSMGVKDGFHVHVGFVENNAFASLLAPDLRALLDATLGQEGP